MPIFAKFYEAGDEIVNAELSWILSIFTYLDENSPVLKKVFIQNDYSPIEFMQAGLFSPQKQYNDSAIFFFANLLGMNDGCAFILQNVQIIEFI